MATDGQMDGRADRRKDGQTDGWTKLYPSAFGGYKQLDDRFG